MLRYTVSPFCLTTEHRTQEAENANFGVKSAYVVDLLSQREIFSHSLILATLYEKPPGYFLSLLNVYA